ncbi:unnamed protein product, partial [Adineta steineri]
ILIKEMENSSNEYLKHNADAVRKKLKNFLPKDKNDQKHVLEENLLINTLKGGMQDAIDKALFRRNLIQQCKNDEGLIDPEILIKEMENSSNEYLKHNADAVRKKLKNFLPKDKNDQKHVLQENLLINTLKGGMQDAIDKVKSPRNSVQK